MSDDTPTVFEVASMVYKNPFLVTYELTAQHCRRVLRPFEEIIRLPILRSPRYPDADIAKSRDMVWRAALSMHARGVPVTSEQCFYAASILLAPDLIPALRFLHRLCRRFPALRFESDGQTCRCIGADYLTIRQCKALKAMGAKIATLCWELPQVRPEFCIQTDASVIAIQQRAALEGRFLDYGQALNIAIAELEREDIHARRVGEAVHILAHASEPMTDIDRLKLAEYSDVLAVATERLNQRMTERAEAN